MSCSGVITSSPSPFLPGDVMINNVKLIREIEKRPSLYNRALKEYANNPLKKRMWDEICGIVLQKNYSKWNKVEKRRAVIALQKRWCNLRTSFIRDLKRMQKEDSSEECTKYRYYNNMHFLIGTGISTEVYGFEKLPPPSGTGVEIFDDDEEGDYEQPEYLEDQEDQEDQEDGRDDSIEDDNSQLRSLLESKKIQFEVAKKDYEVPRKIKREIIYEDDPLQYRNDKNTSMDKNTDGIDQDVNFAMSLVPMFKKLPQSKKLKVQIEILKIFDSVTL